MKSDRDIAIFTQRLNAKAMTTTQINKEIQETKAIMTNLLNCVKAGQKEYYKEYLEVSKYYYKLLQVKPSHNLTIA